MITSKEHIIEYFKSGIKNVDNFKIGIEHEKFLFDLKKIKELTIKLFLRCLNPYMNLAGNQF